MRSTFHSIFLTSAVGGAIGLAVADSLVNGLSGGAGFVIGFLGTFFSLSFLAVVADTGKALLANAASASLKSQEAVRAAYRETEVIEQASTEKTAAMLTSKK